MHRAVATFSKNPTEQIENYQTNVENFYVLKIGLNLFEISKQVLKF